MVQTTQQKMKNHERIRNTGAAEVSTAFFITGAQSSQDQKFFDKTFGIPL